MKSKSEGHLLEIDRLKRWERIIELSKQIAYRDEPPSEIEAALCGAVVRAREFADEIQGLKQRLDAITAPVNKLLDAEDMHLHNHAILKGKWKKGSKAWSGEFIERSVNEAMTDIRAILRP